MKCNLSHKAEQDVLDISANLKLKSRELGESFFDELDDVRDTFSKFPEIAPVISKRLQDAFPQQLKGMRYWRMSKFDKYVIFYRVKKDKIVIDRIIHSRRNMLAIFDDWLRE